MRKKELRNLLAHGVIMCWQTMKIGWFVGTVLMCFTKRTKTRRENCKNWKTGEEHSKKKVKICMPGVRIDLIEEKIEQFREEHRDLVERRSKLRDGVDSLEEHDRKRRPIREDSEELWEKIFKEVEREGIEVDERMNYLIFSLMRKQKDEILKER